MKRSKAISKNLAYSAVFLACLLIGFEVSKPRNPPNQKPDEILHSDAPKEVRSAPPPQANEPHLNWEASDQASLRQLMRSLQDTGFSEDLARSIVRARIADLYKARIDRLTNPLAKYLLSSNQLAEVSQQKQQLRAERDRLTEELGATQEKQEPDPIQRRMEEAFRNYPKVELRPDASEVDIIQFRENRKKRVEYVSRFLSPDEVLEYRLRYDGDTTAIAHLFRGLNLSREEFKQVFQVLDGQELRIVNGSFATELEEKLAASLSPARYEQYKQAMDPANYVFERFIADNRIDSETAQKLRNVRNASATLSPRELQAATAAALGPQLMPQLGHRFISLPKPQRVGKP